MWGNNYGEFHFANNSGISLQKLHMKFVFESNFYNFEYWKSELGLDWLDRLECYNIFTFAIDTIHFYVTFIIDLIFSFIKYLILVFFNKFNVKLAQWIWNFASTYLTYWGIIKSTMTTILIWEKIEISPLKPQFA
jgi:hypothetical protein